MKILNSALLFLFIAGVAYADVKISELPLKAANTTGVSDSFPYVNATTNETDRVLLSDLIHLPAMTNQFSLMIPDQTGENGKFLETNGTITFWSSVAGAFPNQNATTVFAGPTSGPAAAPTFRNLTVNDIPFLAYVSNVTATAPMTSTGGTTPNLAMPVATGSVNGYLSSADWTTFNTVTKLQGRPVAATAPTNGQVLTYNSGTVQWEPAAGGGGSGATVALDNLVSTAVNAPINPASNNSLTLGTPSLRWNTVESTNFGSSGYNVNVVGAVVNVESSGYVALAPGDGPGTIYFQPPGGTLTMYSPGKSVDWTSASQILAPIVSDNQTFVNASNGYFSTQKGVFPFIAAATTGTDPTVAFFAANDDATKGGALIKSFVGYSEIQSALSDSSTTADLKIQNEGGDLYVGSGAGQNANFTMNILPGTNNATNLGSQTKRWKKAYFIQWRDASDLTIMDNTRHFYFTDGNVALDYQTPGTFVMRGHLEVGTFNPTITAGCGTSPSLFAIDGAGFLTVGSGGTDAFCTITFGEAWNNPPACNVNSNTDIVPFKVVTTTTTATFTTSAPLTAGSKLGYTCIGMQ